MDGPLGSRRCLGGVHILRLIFILLEAFFREGGGGHAKRDQPMPNAYVRLAM